MPKEDTALTIFGRPDKEAIESLLTGRTPVNEIKDRVVGGGKRAKYVNTYYMTRQASLITGFRWAAECLEEKIHPGPPAPAQEIAAKMRVTLWDRDGNKVSFESWGCVQVQKQGVLFYDQMKAAYSDGIKKCLSYFGIANDVYGGKDLEFLGQEPPSVSSEELIEVEEVKPETKVTGNKATFMRYMQNNNIPWIKVQEILCIDVIEDIKNFDKALKILKENL